jgi:hypothetical protein
MRNPKSIPANPVGLLAQKFPRKHGRAGLVVVFALRKPAPRAAAQRLGGVGALGRCAPPAITRAEFSQRENSHRNGNPKLNEGCWHLGPVTRGGTKDF